MKTISAHVLVKNEEKFVWYSIMSVIDHVDKLIILDTGSRDKTSEIIEEILKDPRYSKKISYTKVDYKFDEQQIRQKMLRETTTDWFVVVDGDEIWWEDSINKMVSLINDKGDSLESIVVPMYLPVGDIFHYQENKAGQYRFGSKIGHFALRAINTKIPGLSSLKPHGQWGWIDGEGKMIQDRDSKKIGYVDAPYIHTTHLKRTSSILDDSLVAKRTMKLKHEIGIPFPLDFYYPEVFFKERPSVVDSPWVYPSLYFRILSLIQTPLRKIKRRFRNEKVGY